MLIGDANGTDPVPSPTQTQLINQVYRAQLNQLRVSPTDPNILIAEVVLPPDVGGWWVRELALEDKDGVFCAVGNAAPSYKPLLTQGTGRNQVVRMHIITTGTANIQLKIDPSVVLATREYVDNKIQEELYKLDHKPSARVATTANIKLTGLQKVDGVTVIAGDRVLVKDQKSAKENGLYIASTGAWRRAPDADSGAKVTSALVVSVEQGTVQADTIWQLTTDDVIELNTTALTFRQVTQNDAPKRLASQSEVDAGKLDTVAVSPKTMRWGFAASFHTNGYIIFPTWLGGLVIQWVNGDIPAGAGETQVSLPIAFPSTNFGTSISTSSEKAVVVNRYNKTLSSTNVQVRSISSSGVAAPDFQVWYQFICIGK
ncbi:Phage tail-collar fibre protein [Pseudomonas sp. NFACC48-1]|nr:Phage tail-collar fibre protein [Pseudomonas sp. NFACC44-2]SDA88556.1 Phage tail-collar fibre protein [Pseudomonas sp. NFACC51]SFI02310.1 Phage tail-collar fibre protein [Pseudomonas sp. NFACC54]SFL31721.1 Phage tail-collar fibre protein [Pseudomonas sp. NFACC46-3]SFT24278.1 Phage tail-collar fibre protein [Pseudomonas sp. NFACC48-1]